jgi:hypothetical protein
MNRHIIPQFLSSFLLQAAADPGYPNKRYVTPHPHEVLDNLSRVVI